VKFHEAPLAGAFVIELDRLEDERGFFARSFCTMEFARAGLFTHIAQCNVSFNSQAGTLRGLHYQAAPHQEAKLVRCTAGALYDVIVDLRSNSSTYLRWFGIELEARNWKMLYVPEGFAHGFQTLADATEVLYMMSARHHPDSARGIRWDDPAINIRWPHAKRRLISDRDSSFALLQ
jgi:dTDP-4-dehydrorhamnose 3,5-epimerase